MVTASDPGEWFDDIGTVYHLPKLKGMPAALSFPSVKVRRLLRIDDNMFMPLSLVKPHEHKMSHNLSVKALLTTAGVTSLVSQFSIKDCELGQGWMIYIPLRMRGNFIVLFNENLSISDFSRLSKALPDLMLSKLSIFVTNLTQPLK